MNRDLDKVIDAMITVIPDTFMAKEGLRIQLEAVKRDYLAGESHGWTSVANILETRLGRADEGWKLIVAKLFRGEINYGAYLWMNRAKNS